MGNFMPSLPFVGGKGLKRKSSEDDLLDDDEYAASGKRRKLATTSSYIFKALYQEGQNSDITINALGFQWNLHRVYLCQSAYFASMFEGANAEEVEIEINNPNITKEDEIEIDPDIVIHVLAAASLFQLHSLIRETKSVLCNSICLKNALEYYQFSSDYGYTDVSNVCFGFMQINLFGLFFDHPTKLREVSFDLMIKLLMSVDVYLQTEFATYTLTKVWSFLKLNPKWIGDKVNSITSAYKYFRARMARQSFLDCEEGKRFIPVYKVLRIHHLNSEIIEGDKLIPQRWIVSAEIDWCYQILRVELGVDKGQIWYDQVFNNYSFRCGKMLMDDTYQSWQWIDCHSMIDISVTFENLALRFLINQRQCTDFPSPLLENDQTLFRITVSSVNDQHQRISFDDSQIMNLNIGKNEEIQILKLMDTATFPILLSASFLVFSPAKTPAEAKIDAVNFT